MGASPSLMPPLGSWCRYEVEGEWDDTRHVVVYKARAVFARMFPARARARRRPRGSRSSSPRLSRARARARLFSSRRAQAGHAPQEFAPPPVNPAAAAAAAAKASRAPKPASLYGRAPARAPEANVQALGAARLYTWLRDDLSEAAALSYAEMRQRATALCCALRLRWRLDMGV